jgi:hypothetical protein
MTLLQSVEQNPRACFDMDGSTLWSTAAAYRYPARLEGDPQASPGGPDNPAALPGATEQELESMGQLVLPADLEAGAARGVVNHPAINGRSFRVNNKFGHIGISACRSNPGKQPWAHFHPLFKDLKPNR